MTNNEVTLQVPLALQHLICSNNQLLKNYQKQLIQEVEEANNQMMRILQLDPSIGWQLDMERMVYTRPNDVNTPQENMEQQPTE